MFSQVSRGVGERPQTGRDAENDAQAEQLVGFVQKVVAERVQTFEGWRRRGLDDVRASQIPSHVVPAPVDGGQGPVGLLDGKTRGSAGVHVTTPPPPRGLTGITGIAAAAQQQNARLSW